jgi:transcriptional regulator with XRE-family HTH domain
MAPYHALTCRNVPQIMDGMSADSLGLRIRRARERKRWTQAQLAEAVGVSARAVGDWERDVKRPLNSIGAIEHVLGVDLTSDGEPDPQELEIRELAARLGLTPAEQDGWVEQYRRRRPAPDARERAS